MRCGDVLCGLPESVLIGVAHAHEWDNYGLVSVESPLIYSIVDALLGGRRGTTPSGTEGRAFTSIESGLVANMIQIIIDELQHAFAPLSKIRFSLDRVDANHDRQSTRLNSSHKCAYPLHSSARKRKKYNF